MIGQLSMIDVLARFVTNRAGEGVKVAVGQAVMGQIGQELADVSARRLIVGQLNPDVVTG